MQWNKLWISKAAGPVGLVAILLMGKMLLARMVIFEEVSVARWLFIGMNTILVALMLVELLATKRKFWWLMMVNGVFTSVLFAAIMYHKYYGVIVTYRALAQVGQVFQVRASVVNLTDPYYVLIFADILLLSSLFVFHKGFKQWAGARPFLNRRLAAGLLAVSVLACYGNIMTNASIYNEVSKAEQMGIINYEVYEIARAIGGDAEVDVKVTASAIQTLKQTRKVPDNEKELYGIAQDRHVLIIQLESFQNFLIHLKVDDQEITPNLNRLIEDSLYFPNVYQQIGQGNTSDSEYMLNTSLYIPPNGAASQVYGEKKLPSFPKLLKEYGYESMTFHTNDLKFWNRDALYKALGIDKMYDDDFFGEEDVIAFGASDDVLYEKTLPELMMKHATGERFYANVISMSAHHPYHLPEELAELSLPEAYDDTLVGRYLISQHYADAALGRFMEELKASGLWENSVIAIYGDHMGLPMYSMEEADLDYMKQFTGREYTYADMFNIPFIIAVPDTLEEGRQVDHIGGHVDFMPTLTNLLGVSMNNRVHFGQDLLNQPSNLLPERYYLPTGSFINDEVVFIPGEGYEDGRGIVLGGGEEITPKQEWADDFTRAMQLLEMSDAYVESLPNREP